MREEKEIPAVDYSSEERQKGRRRGINLVADSTEEVGMFVVEEVEDGGGGRRCGGGDGAEVGREADDEYLPRGGGDAVEVLGRRLGETEAGGGGEEEERCGGGDGEEEISDGDGESEERNAFQIEQAVVEFEDELPIRHNMYPHSESDEEEDVPERDHNVIKSGDGRLYKNQIFYNGIAFKDAVLDYALSTGRNLKQFRYDTKKLEYKCVGDGCEWRIYCSVVGKSGKWRVKRLKDVHTCNPNGDCEMIKVSVIARLFLDKIRDEPEYFMPLKIQETIKERWKISVSRAQCQAARNKALKWIEKEYDEQFARLHDYAAEIVKSNPYSTVEVDTLKNGEGQDVFNRFYVCFDAIRRTWKETCRPLIGVDGTFIKAKVKGQLLVALGRDANNAIYPIAWGCVQVENIDNWCWFVRKLKDDLGLVDGDGYIMVSDRQKGLIKAVEIELPRIEHRMCVRHIYENLKKNHGKKKEMKPFIWNLAWSYNEAEYLENLERLFNYDKGVYDDVIKSQPRTWCRAFYKIGNYCEDVDNNSTESFNGSVVKARDKPFVLMLETIRRLAMVRIAKRSVISNGHKGKCTPYVTEFLQAEFEKVSKCKVRRSTNGMYESDLNGCSYRVNLVLRTCTCRKWDICGIPCEHAYGVIIDKKLEVEDYVCHWFRTAMWKKNYTEGLVPQSGPRFWPSTCYPNVHIPNAPPQVGRKKLTKKDKKRKRGKNESPQKKQPKELKRIMHCGVCGAANHNSRFHKKSTKVFQQEPSQGIQQEPSQGTISQVESSQGTVSQIEWSLETFMQG